MSNVADWTRQVDIKKLDEAQNLVFGVISQIVDKDGTPVVDQQGDLITVAELEKAAYDFMLNSRASDVMHDGQAAGAVAESFVSTPEKRALLGGDPADKSVFWWVGVKTHPAIFAKARAGELKAFSIGGRAIRVPV